MPQGLAGKLTVGSLAITVGGVTPVAITAAELDLNTTGLTETATIGGTSFDFSDDDHLDFLAVSATATLALPSAASP